MYPEEAMPPSLICQVHSVQCCMKECIASAIHQVIYSISSIIIYKLIKILNYKPEIFKMVKEQMKAILAVFNVKTV